MKNTESKISVIVPVFRTEKYLERCVKSICSQTYRNIEILLVDDGSDDGCPALCDHLAEGDSRISVIHKKNGGLSSARNAGLERAEGGYISFIDSDDYVAENFLQQLLKTLEATKADMVKADYLLTYDSHGNANPSHEPVKVYEGPEIQSAFLNLQVDSACVFLYRRDLIGDLRFEEGKTSEDIPFNFEIFKKAAVFAYLPERLYFYYQNGESISNGPLDRNKLNYLIFREQILKYYEGQENPAWILKSEALYARAAMGLMTRMALYGISADLDEKQCRQKFKSCFSRHQRAFYRDPDIPGSRKLMAVLVFNCYPLAKILRGFVR